MYVRTGMGTLFAQQKDERPFQNNTVQPFALRAAHGVDLRGFCMRLVSTFARHYFGRIKPFTQARNNRYRHPSLLIFGTAMATLALPKEILIGSDHGGFEMKEMLKMYLEKQHGATVVDVGTYSTESCDYPDVAKTLGKQVVEKTAGSEDMDAMGILVCGTGIGISIAANKIQGVRCALCHDHFTATMSRRHNNANVLALGGRTTGAEIAKQIVEVFLSEKFEGGRHARRVEKMERQ